MKKMPLVFVITLNWNRKYDTEECVDSLLQMTYPNFEVVVVDNGSEDGSVEYLKEKFGDKIHIVANEKNLGYSEGFNSGINYGMERGAHYFLIVNNDTKIDKEALTELVRVAETDPKIGFVSGKVYFYDRPEVIQTVGKRSHPITLVGPHVGAGEVDKGQYDEIKEYEFIDDVFLLVRREVVEKIGGYDKIFFLYWEETDWCARLRKAGYKILYTPHAKIWHKGSLSSGGGMNPLNTFWITRNRYIFIKRHGNLKQWRYFLLWNYFYNIPRTLAVRVLKGKFSLAFSFIKGNLAGLSWVLKNKEG